MNYRSNFILNFFDRLLNINFGNHFELSEELRGVKGIDALDEKYLDYFSDIRCSNFVSIRVLIFFFWYSFDRN